ncbi:MAG: transcription elongation factor GreA [SAR324 cluster bacterium]|jgi:transcription elongation factor GreA|nr:transcription elongation factor GreA [SAR324 cluster bacterium]MDG1487305.1 transcription elongation factor GreA [SAR324 cluster bacterium]MDG2064169.1 transcription elongation factor GreA [SAR324 cluster bacterium]MDP6210395.1 transcription elongation factor GreA [SAR324 cluster bacterium]MDP6295714.1 transcription elongation factor GreA [SAR324 cluster bacterium]|tara:strand:+ start:321 stop:800 length:480 start_codon:yes stop_codon:yes gene_type:complete
MSESYPMTQLGYESLKTELKQLTSKDRPAVINAISTAREHGDLKENAEYHAAKEQQGFIEGRIQELNEKLALANVIDITKLSGEKVVFGATVSFVDVDTDEESNYQIVGADESDLQKNKISISSPIARALIGKSVGDTLSIPIPKGKIEIEILKVEFAN